MTAQRIWLTEESPVSILIYQGYHLLVLEFADGPTTMCICQDGFVGPGKYCNADLLDTVANTSVLTDYYQVSTTAPVCQDSVANKCFFPET